MSLKNQDRSTDARKAILDTLEANCGVCRAEHLVQRGEYYGYTEDELREAAVGLGIVGVTVDGMRYVGLPTHEKKLHSWSEYHASVVRYYRTEAEKELASDAIELNDSLPDFD